MDNTVYKEAGIRIMRLREINQYTRDEFAELADVTPKFLYEIENGKKGFSARTLMRISEAFGVSCDYILYGNKVDRKISDKTIDVIEQFDEAQRRSVQSILTEIYKISKASKK